MSSGLKKLLKRATMYPGRVETESLRDYLGLHHRAGWPYCPPDEGDLLYLLADQCNDGDALEVGFATGSSAGYMLIGLGAGRLVSIDYNQDNHQRQGERLVRELGMADRHRLVERNSVEVLPEMWTAGSRFDLIFLDGWKTFDHVWVDTFYCARMLKVGGHIMFDDARMPAVRKCISILERYYGFKKLDSYARVGGWRQRLWHLMTNRTLLPPYVALRKTCEVSETPAGSQFEYWRNF